MLICLVAVFVSAASKSVAITSDRFEADETKRVTKFIGHVHLEREEDELNASVVTVHFDEKRRPVRYEAAGGASFVLHMKKADQYYTGKADRLIYLPGKEIYELFGNVLLKQPELDRVISGEKVIVERRSGKASVEGGRNRPVKFIFKVEEPDGAKDR